MWSCLVYCIVRSINLVSFSEDPETIKKPRFCHSTVMVGYRQRIYHYKPLGQPCGKLVSINYIKFAPILSVLNTSMYIVYQYEILYVLLDPIQMCKLSYILLTKVHILLTDQYQ